MYKVAVYGTLRQGQRNHYLLEQANYLFNTGIEGFIYDLGGCPGFRRILDGWDYPEVCGPVVQCEVYEVTKSTLSDLDRLEGHGYGFYERIIAPGFKDVFIYEICEQRGKLITSGDWVKYYEDTEEAY